MDDMLLRSVVFGACTWRVLPESGPITTNDSVRVRFESTATVRTMRGAHDRSRFKIMNG